MPGTSDLKAFLEERLLSWDPDIDLTEGSPAQIEIVDPIVRRFTPDPFEMDIPAFISARLEQEYPGISKDEGEALADLLIKPIEALFDPIIREVEFLRKNKSLSDPTILSPDEANSLMGNIFIRRRSGSYAVGRVRIWFNAPTAVSINVGNVFSTGDGLNFLPSSPQSISAEEMLFNQDGNLFYMDVSVKAEKVGDAYNVEPLSIISVTGINSSVKVRNLRRLRDGSAEESTVAFVDRGENSISERSLVVPRGAYARLFDQFVDLQHLQVVGFNSPEMQRDVIKGGSLGPIIIFGTDGVTSDDGDADGYTSIFSSATGGFIEKIGSAGKVQDFVLSVDGKDYPINEVVSDTMLLIGASFIPGTEPVTPAPHPDLADDLSAKQFYIRKSSITLSDIPGGISRIVTSDGVMSIRNNEVHIGGCTDFYVRGTSIEDAEQVIAAVSDEEPLMGGLNLSTRVSGYPNDIVVDNTLTSATNFSVMGVQPGHTLIIETDAGNAGTYQILKVAPNANPNLLQVDPAPTSSVTGQKYKIVDEIDVNLTEPKTVKGSGNDLITVLGSSQVSTVSAVNFNQLAVEAGDTLRITGNTLNAGDYTIQSVTGTGNVLLVLSTKLRRTSSTESWEIFTAQQRISYPVVRVKDVELLDSSNQPTGMKVPYADPVDIQSYAFSNIGVGSKIQIQDAVLGILSSPIITPAAINTKTLRIQINGGVSSIITFSGVSTAQHIVDQINTALPGYNLASLYEVNNETRISIGSRNNWVVVKFTGTANSVLGFSTTVDEDNRQVVSASTSDWTDVGLNEGSDSVYILTGSNIEFWYIHSIAPSKILISRVDQEGWAVFPLTDHSASLRAGSRSFGKLRCYFLNPTSFEVRGSYRGSIISVGEHSANVIYGNISHDETSRTNFLLDVFGDGTAHYKFFPDPELKHQLIPAYEEDVPNNLRVVTAGDKFIESEKDLAVGPGKDSRDEEIDFLLREVLPEDILEITYQPIQGTADIRPTPDGVVDYDPETGNIVSKTLVFSLENKPEKTVTFSAEVDGPDRLVSEINSQLGEVMAYVETDSDTSEKFLRLESDFLFMLKPTGTANSVLGLAGGDNIANAAGSYVIDDVGYIAGTTSNHMRMSLRYPVGESSWSGFSAAQLGPSQHFKIHRPGVQRISSTEMEENKEGSLYYADVEVVSDGPGDEFNIEAARQLTVENHKSDGYRLYNINKNLAFSEYEDIRMKISRRMIPPGSTDSPENAVLISSQNIQINYQRSSIVSDIQSFASSRLDRVLTAHIVVRHLIPHFVQFELDYIGGSQVQVVQADIENLINGLLPDELLESSAISDIVRRRGATRVFMPIVLIGLVHQEDRKIRVVRSVDSISTGRLSTFIVDELTITRDPI